MKVSKLLKVFKQKHETLGEIIVLYTPTADDGGSAVYIDEEDGKEVGVGMRLTKKTARALAAALSKLAKETK